MNFIRILFSLLALFVFIEKSIGTPYVITIDNQRSFDNINSKLSQAIDGGQKDIQIRIVPGVYYYKERQIHRSKEQHPEVSVCISGQDATLIAAGSNYHKDSDYIEKFSPYTTYVETQELKAYDYWEDCVFSDGRVIVVDKDKKLCCLPFSKAKNTSPEDCKNIYITIPQWFKSSTYKVTKIEKGNIYFIADRLEYIQKRGREDYTINYDYLFAGQTTRFKLCNPLSNSKPMQIRGNKIILTNGTIHECKAAQFLSMEMVQYKNFMVTGLRFLGNTDNGTPLIDLHDTKMENVTISNCSFEHIQSKVIYADNTSNLTFSTNSLTNCNNHGIETTNSCRKTTVINNSFSNCGGNMLQTFCVSCKGSNYYIAHNIFKNFGYSAIGIGMWYGSKKNHESSGIVEYNEIWYDSDYLAHLERHTLMDSGAIYLWTQNDDAIIRYNYIHDFSGMFYNHGIYCDDGASHYKLYGNIIINIQSNNSIDARTCQSEFPESNQDIQMMYNIVDRPIKFEGNTKYDNGCIKSRNILLYKIGEDIPKHIYAHLKTKKQDKQLLYEDWDEQGIIVSNKTMKTLKQLPCFDQIKQYIKKK